MAKRKSPSASGHKPHAATAASSHGRSLHAFADAGSRAYQGPDALGPYTTNPAAHVASGRVLYYTDDFVAVQDKFPKASVHFLLLLRDKTLFRQHPVTLLSRPGAAGDALRASVRAEAEKLKALAAAELRRRFGKFSAADAVREAVLRGDDDEVPGAAGEAVEKDASGLPHGRDWAKDVLVGVHARPSMNHVHIHVLSRDMHSDKVRHRRHYNSFATPFLVRLDEFPLAADDARNPHTASSAGRKWLSAETAQDGEDEPASTADNVDNADDGAEVGSSSMGDTDSRPHLTYLRDDMKCWRCRRNFGNRFKELKHHLDEEFEAWKRE